MLTCNFEPTICKSKPATEATDDAPASPEVIAKFSGKIVLKPLAYDERLEFLELQAIAQFEAGDDENKKMMALLRLAREFAKHKLSEFFVSSTLTRLEDGYLFDTLDQIKLDGPASGCIPEIAAAIMSGTLSLGK